MKAIICDDDPNVIRQLGEIIEMAYGDGVELVASDSVEALLSAGEDNDFEMAFIDIELGGESGIDAAERLLRLRPNVKVVFITAHVRRYAEEDIRGTQAIRLHRQAGARA